MATTGKGKKVVKKVVSAAKKAIKKNTTKKALLKHAGNAVKGMIRGGVKGAHPNLRKPKNKYSASVKIKLGNNKKKR